MRGPCSGAQQTGPSGIQVGLFLASDGPAAADAAELRRGAQLAVEDCAGAAGPCAAVAAAGSGQWNAGAGELIRLVYGEGARAVLGPADRRSAHLAEQVVARAKGRFLLLTPWATDPTLTQIKVPWFFRLAPDDRAQARALLGEIAGLRGLRAVAVAVAASDPDARAAAHAFEAVARTAGMPELRRIPFDETPAACDRLVADVTASRAEALILVAPPAAAAVAARRLRRAGVAIPLFGPLALASPAFLDAAGEAAEGMVLAAPPDASGPAAQRFRARYRATYGREPSVPAAYGHDGAAVLIAALHVGEESLRGNLAATRYDGMTGLVVFDAAGNRDGPAPLARVVGGRLQPMCHDDDRGCPTAVEPVTMKGNP